MVFPKSKLSNIPLVNGSLILSLWLCITLFLFSAARAEEVIVARDGSLIFAEPNVDAAVLDIVSRGTRLQCAEKMGEWCKILLSDQTRNGFIRTEVLQMTGSTAPSLPKPEDTGTTAYSLMKQQIDNFQAKLHQAEKTLDNIEQVLMEAETRKLAEKPAKKRTGESITGENGMTGLPGSPFGFGLFSGLYFKGTNYTAGGSLTWFPSFLKSLGLEFEGGYTFLEKPLKQVYASLDLYCPLPWKMTRLEPYVVFGGGINRLEMKTESRKAEIDPLASLGIGAVVPLAGGISLRADLRSVTVFTAGERDNNGRFYLALCYR
jgi:hypothetical protein